MSANVSANFDQPLRVLMLGWEYPPRFAGGLGKACSGLSHALAAQGCQVTFVLPSFRRKIIETRLRVVGARELLVEAGWPQRGMQASKAFGARAPGTPAGAVREQAADARLFPYGAHPGGAMPDSISRLLERLDSGLPDLAPRAQGSEEPAPTGGGESEIYGKNLWTEIERYCSAVRQIAQGHEVEVVHAHDWMSIPAALEFQRVHPRVPVFVHVHATEYDRSGENVNTDVFRIEREGFRRSTHIFAVSRYTATIIEKLYGVRRDKITVVYNAPDDATKVLIEEPDKPREPRVVFLGRLTFQKGPDHFLEAAKIAIDAAPKRMGNIQFLFCGTGDMLPRLRAQARRLGIEDRVHFAGFTQPREVDQILSRSRVLVMPSVSEPFGLVALEAIHCGIPVILSKQSGVREVLQRALQVDFWDHEKLADQILAAFRLRALSTQLVQEGMNQIRSLSWENSARTVVDAYRRHLA